MSLERRERYRIGCDGRPRGRCCKVRSPWETSPAGALAWCVRNGWSISASESDPEALCPKCQRARKESA